MEDKYFKQALSDFTIEFASGDAIRTLADKGYSVKKIKSKLDFPTPEERIKEIVWKHYIDNKTICLKDPKESMQESYTIEKVFDSLGRPSFKQVSVRNDGEIREYEVCDFGKRLYQNREAFMASLSALDEEEKDYILGLPWPPEEVWHVKNENFKKILSKL